MRPQYAPVEWEDEADWEAGGSSWAGDASGKFRPRKRGAVRPSHGVHGSHGGHGPSPKLTPLRYIRAQCRLVVHPDFPFASYSAAQIPLEAIQRVVMPPLDCPICTCTATVPRMLECGHVMCLPCYLRFLRYTEDKFCPICGEFTGDSAVLPVSFLAAPKEFLPQPGHFVVLRLMHKMPGLPAVPLGTNPTEKPRPESLLYSRVVCASTSYLRSEYKAERDLLEAEQAEALVEFGGDECYPEALASVRRALQTKLEAKTWKQPPSGVPSALAAEAWFYQTAFESSTVYVLSNLDVTILKSLHGEFSEFPSTLEVEVENILFTNFEGTDLRKRFKFLEHVPDHSQLALIEVRWRDLPAAVYERHKKALQNRRRATASKKRQEDSQKAAAESYADVLLRAQAAEGPLMVAPPPSIKAENLPTLGASTSSPSQSGTPAGTPGASGASTPRAPPRAKVWHRNGADQRDSEEILAAARQRGKAKGKWLVIQ